VHALSSFVTYASELGGRRERAKLLVVMAMYNDTRKVKGVR